MNPGPPNDGGAAPSFKTNVNRAKTKRWVEAKSYTYDGDDWGDADDYDEYGGYDEPAPTPRPTGLRQAGQSSALPQTGGNPPEQRPDSVPDVQQQYGSPRPAYQQPERERANSFGRGDERRAFSGPGPNVVTPARTAYSQAPEVPTDDRRWQHPPANSGAPRMQQPFPQQGQPRRPSFDRQGRPVLQDAPRGYLDRPQQSLDGNRSQSMTSNTPSVDFQRRDFSNPSAMPQPLHASRPPRKSSLGQQEAPARGSGSIPPISTDVVAPTDSTPPSTTRDRSQSGSGARIVRPADIYRRMQEEKEKERLSQDSGRPSMDAILGGHSSRDESPAPKSGEDSDVARRRKPVLESVAERKSEYGMEGLLSANKAQPQGIPRGTKTRPILPEIPGFGEGFGEGFGDSLLGSLGPAKSSKVGENQPQRVVSPDTNPAENGANLQHQPSLGFRSVVHQAFDEPTVPPTPSSATGSMARSNSESTNAISPIISREPSAAEPLSVDTKMKSIAEEPLPATPSRRRSTESPSTPKARDAQVESPDLPPSFIPGHRRNTSTPSPGNSPARTPAIEVNRPLRHPQEVEIAMATPTSAAHSTSSASDEPARSETTSLSNVDEKANVAGRSQAMPAATPNRTSRPGSPTKGRVRDLADKFDGASNSRRGSDSSLGETAKLGSSPTQRPQSDHNESFRPPLPGAWASYVSNAPSQEKQKSGRATPQPGPDPLSAAKNAGSALADAISSATGLSKDSESERAESSYRGRASTQDTTIHPEALMVPTHVDDSTSSIVPIPIHMKDGGHPEYFAPVVPLKQKSPGSSFSDLPPLSKPHDLEDMSTENSPSDLESDRLRKELVRELSPHVESFDDNITGAKAHERSTGQNPTRSQTQDSMGLPSEYDSYWNGSVDENVPSQEHAYAGNANAYRTDHLDPDSHSHPSVPQVAFSPIQEPDQHNVSVTAPERSGSQNSLQVEHGLVHRFSWEPLPEELNTENDPAPSNSTAQPQDLPVPGQTKDLHNAFTAPVPKPNVNKELPDGPFADETADPGLQRQLEKDAEILQSVPPRYSNPPQTVPAENAMKEDSLPALPVTEPAKIPAFREIMALKTADERIHAFNAMRDQFAGMNTGLANWIAVTTSNFPEHSHLLSNGGVYGVQNQVSRLAAGTNTGTSTASLTPASTSGRTGFSPGGGKITTQQVQAKGKDLLHSTKVFGGKANSTAKGLFAKGKSRFRSGGGDKVDI